MYPPFAHAQVVSVDAARGILNVMFNNGQMLGTGVRVLHHGPADAMRVNRKPLPNRGTWGIVAFPYGSSRNGIWMGSYYTAGQDALPDDGTDPHMDYEAHHSGAWTHMDGAGRYTKSFPDGSYLTISDTTTRPPMFRHIVDAKQVRRRVPYTDAERIPSPPTPRQLFLSMGSGTTVGIDATGNVAVTGAAPSGGTKATITMTFGGTVVTIDPIGNVTFTLAGGSTFKVASGNVEFDLAGGSTFKVGAGASAADQLVLVSKMIAAFNAHTHPAVNATPTTPLVPANIQSAIMDVSA